MAEEKFEDEGVCQECFDSCPPNEAFCCDECERKFNMGLMGEYESDSF